MVAGKQTVNGVRSSRGEKFGIGTRHQKRGLGWCAHPWHQQRANLCVLASGRYPRATLACHLPPNGATCHRRRILPQNPDKKLHCIKMHFPPPGWGISPKCYNIHSTKECLETFFQTKPSRIQGFHIFKICYVGEIAMKLSKLSNF